MAFKPRQVGALNSLEFRMFFEKEGKIVSPFHDIPLYTNDAKNGMCLFLLLLILSRLVLNMVVEIPRWTNAKLEISKDVPFNPIKQDVKKGKLRYVKNCFPHHGY